MTKELCSGDCFLEILECLCCKGRPGQRFVFEEAGEGMYYGAEVLDELCVELCESQETL